VNVGSVLSRRFDQVGDIVKVGRGVWGLAEWYPNRSFKRKGSPKGENGSADLLKGEAAEVAPTDAEDASATTAP
jgi:hypothetical protein